MIKKLNPDIKISPKGVAYIPTEKMVKRRLARISNSDTEAERQRLRDAVVEAGLRHRRAGIAIDTFWDNAEKLNNSGLEVYPFAQEVYEARLAFISATDALIKFEIENEVGLEK